MFTFSSLPEARAVCGSAARTDLCGGRWATSVPTATLLNLYGNSSGENDGAAVCVLMSKKRAKELNLEPLGTLKAFAFSGADPRSTWKSASVAATLALKKAGVTIQEIDLIEIHEAFAVQALANMKEL